MNYFKDKNNKVFAYDNEQIEQGFGKDLTSITEEEMKTLTYVEPVINPKAEGEIYTLNDVDYQVPFMKDDADGLLQVKSAFDLGVNYTVIHFTNGTKIPIASSEFIEFAIWFVNKRNSFFVGE